LNYLPPGHGGHSPDQGWGEINLSTPIKEKLVKVIEMIIMFLNILFSSPFFKVGLMRISSM
jgi:hypothetical protein